MKVFVLGGTGSIGTGLVNELVARNHSVTALSRSAASDRALETSGARPLRGDLDQPSGWIYEAAAQDALIQIAATFGDDMGEVDEKLLAALIDATNDARRPLRVLYTGGCWLYGATGDAVATEETPFDPLPSFDWMVKGGEKLLSAPFLSTAIIHPAMVYHAQGGVFERFLTAAQARRPVEIWGAARTRWPIIERSDLARAYCDILARPDLTGHFNAGSEEGVRVGDIVEAFVQHYGGPSDPIVLSAEEVVAEHGAWAKGPTIDQQMSSRKLRDATGWTPLITDFRSSALFAA